MLPIRTILHPTDFSEPSRFAFQLACSLARDYDAELIICHVIQPLIPLFGEGLIPPIPEGYEEEMGEALLRLQPPDGIQAVHLLESGPPVEEILRVAKESRVNLIVMGTHGRRGLRRVLLGSVAEQVLRDACCPVLTVKTPFSPQAPSGPKHLAKAARKRMPAYANTGESLIGGEIL